MQLLWRRAATTTLHRERSSARGKGSASPVQWCRERGTVRRHIIYIHKGVINIKIRPINNIDPIDRYFEQIYKPICLSSSGYIFLGALMGILFGFVAYGMSGILFNTFMLISVYFVRNKAEICMKMNKRDIRLFLYAYFLSLVLGFYTYNMGFAIYNLVTLDTIYVETYFGLKMLLYSLCSFLILNTLIFIIAKHNFNPNKYQLEYFEKGKLFGLIGSLGAGTGAAFGYFLSRIFRNNIGLSIIIWILVFCAEASILTFCAYYLLMYKRLAFKEN
jgi:hypothetical protein